jgi:chromosome segregation ATPase
MNLVRYGAILLSGLALVFLQGCGDSTPLKPAAEKEHSQAVITNLQSQLAQAHDDIQRGQQKNEELIAQVQSLAEKLKQAQSEPAKSPTKAERKAATVPAKDARGKAAPDESKIQLMGEKAVAEYRAAQLSRRLDELSKDLDRKESEMAAISQKAGAKEAEVEQLRQQIEKLQTADRTRTAELNSRLQQITKDLETSSSEAKKLKQEVDAKSDLLDALKNAVGDAGKLKSTAESEVTRLRTELAEMAKQLEAAQAVAEQNKTLSEQNRSIAEQNKTVAEQWQQEAEQFRMRAEASEKELQSERERVQASVKELQDLKAQTEELTSRIQALEREPEGEAEEEAPSRIDRLLKGPQAQETPKGDSSLY